MTQKFQEFDEENLRIRFPSGIKVIKFDGGEHGLSHCMKAVDFIVELQDKYIFIELKDPQHPKADEKAVKHFMDELQSGVIDRKLTQKFRDSFLYRWATKAEEKPVFYYVLLAIDTLDHGMLTHRTDKLKQELPCGGPAAGVWKRPVAAGCSVFNLETWNSNMSSYPVFRLHPPP